MILRKVFRHLCITENKDLIQKLIFQPQHNIFLNIARVVKIGLEEAGFSKNKKVNFSLVFV
jgi:hypothetical protein